MESKLNQLAVLILQEEEAYKDMQVAKKRHAACLIFATCMALYLSLNISLGLEASLCFAT